MAVGDSPDLAHSAEQVRANGDQSDKSGKHDNHLHRVRPQYRLHAALRTNRQTDGIDENAQYTFI
ncbi:hypothetical protein DPMN_120706 [Dreissena polymorpha]|uniref:Uncharacterized protein n=1 Tax=Dreissena polymorpha TaxID=45954 RepID=A0A9D4JNT8_DREPO|nr:hypothetical protein DPMN_120706 [Dreissena polymorpha]